MIWNNPHQQPSKENMKSSVKIQENTTQQQKKWKCAEIFAKQELEEDEEQEERKNQERRRNF